MNYYFQSKENLLEQIFDFSIRENGHKLRQILSSNLPLEEKIRQYIYTYTDILIEDPLIVPFVLSTIHRKAEKSPYLKSIHTLYSTENFAKQLRQRRTMEKSDLLTLSNSSSA
jgi:AcrR family transcriptional regulator